MLIRTGKAFAGRKIISFSQQNSFQVILVPQEILSILALMECKSVALMANACQLDTMGIVHRVPIASRINIVTWANVQISRK